MTDAPPVPAAAAAPGGAPLTPAQQTVLQAIYDYFSAHGTWPPFDRIDRPLRREHAWDIADIIEKLPKSLLIPPAAGNSRPTPQDRLRLTVEGIATCRGSDTDTARFAQTLRWLAEQEMAYEPAADADDALPRVASTDIAAQLGLDADDPLPLRRLRGMLNLDHWGLGGFNGTEDHGWHVMLTRDIWRFRNVQTIEDCIQIRAGWLAEDDVRALSSSYRFTRATVTTPLLLQAQPAADGPATADRGRPDAARSRYVSGQVTETIRAKAGQSRFDLTKLLTQIDELNDNYADQHTYAVHALLRAILDHVPPILGYRKFEEVANNYKWSQTDKAYMRKLMEFRSQADDALHRTISKQMSLLAFDHLPSAVPINRLLQECADRL